MNFPKILSHSSRALWAADQAGEKCLLNSRSANNEHNNVGVDISIFIFTINYMKIIDFIKIDIKVKAIQKQTMFIDQNIRAYVQRHIMI